MNKIARVGLVIVGLVLALNITLSITLVLPSAHVNALNLSETVMDCEQISALVPPKTAQEEKTLIPILQKLAKCRTPASRKALLALLQKDQVSADTKTEILYALAFHAQKQDLPMLFSHYSASEKRLKALMQAVAFHRPHVKLLGAVDWAQLQSDLSNATYRNQLLYLLTRLRAVETVIDFSTINNAYHQASAAQDADGVVLAIRLMGAYDASAPKIAEIIRAVPTCASNEALSPGSLQLREQMAILQFIPAGVVSNSVDILIENLKGTCEQMIVESLDYIQRNQLAPLRLAPYVEKLTAKDQPASIKLAALSIKAALNSYRQSGPPAHTIWASLFIGNDYFMAWAALGKLSRDTKGKDLIKNLLAKVQFERLQDDATYMLTPKKYLSTLPASTRAAPLGRTGYIKLETSKGVIAIRLDPDSIVAASFADLVKEGRMDGMIWHRVIQNFVAQAGQTPMVFDPKWPTIKDEWVGKAHQVGTVGLATAGRDTGSTQFFINTNYNQHLDDRYTVFGRVTVGMDVAFSLMQGDKILKATYYTNKWDMAFD